MTSIDSETLAFSAEYGDALADHLPMARYALEAMGADRSRRNAFAARYIEAKSLRVLSSRDREMHARDAFHERMLAEGWPTVFRSELASLANGLGAGAFHAFIRAAYGILADDAREIAAALVYWRSAALDLGSTSNVPIDDDAFDPPVALARVRSLLGGVPETLRPGLIAQRMRAVAREPAFDAACGHPRVAADFTRRIARCTVRAFAAGRNFTLLHAMTATHALRIIEPYAPDREALYRSFWRAYVAAWVDSGAVPLRDRSDFEADVRRAPPWTDLLPLARASDDEHVVKATFTAWSEDAVYDDPLYRVAAARYLRLL